MCRDNTIVTIYLRNKGKPEPIHAFTMHTNDIKVIVLKVADWIIENRSKDLERYSFEYEELEQETQIWEGI